MSDRWMETVALILTPSCVMVIIGFLGRSVVKQFLERNLEAHKAALSASSEQQVENLKAELRRTAYEHQVVFGKLHADRAEAIKALFQRALSLGTVARSFAAGQDVTNTQEFEQSQRSVSSCLEAVYEQVFESRIFFSEQLCLRIDKLLQDIREPASDIAGGYLIPLRSPEERLQVRLADKHKLQEATWFLEAEIAVEFRKLLGVN